MGKTIGLAALLWLLPAVAAAQTPTNRVPPAPTTPHGGAQTCSQSVMAMADRLGISLDQDTAPAVGSNGATGGASNSERLAASSGVVRPPDTSTRDVLAPPPTGDQMATAAAAPQSGSGVAAPPVERSGAVQLQLKAALSAAQAAARRGDETQCQASLADATGLAQTKP